jgi:hypothetical protein
LHSSEMSMNSIRPTHPASPISTLATILLALLIPPLPLIHSWLLAQVYRYAFQPGEKQAWHRLSRMITGAISVCAAVAIALWYTDLRVTFIRIVMVMTLICVVLGIGGAVWIARERQFSRRFTLLIALAAGLVSLIIPAGVVGVQSTWPVVFTGIVGYWYIRHENEQYLERNYAALTNWQIDSIALGGMAAALMCLIGFGAGILLVVRIQDALPLFFIGITSIVIFSAGMGRVMRFHLSGFAGKKKNSNGAYDTGSFFWHWLTIALIWGFLSVFVAVVVFFAQLFALGVFIQLADL